MLNILITGSNGQLGKCIKDINKSNKNTWIYANKETLDITNEKNIKEFINNNKIDIIINCAAYTNVDKAEKDVFNATKINGECLESLANICKKNNILLIHISTDYVFDGKITSPLKPSYECKPLNIYGLTKRLGEKNIEISGCRYLIFRTSWLYSQYGNNFVKKMVHKCLNKENVKVVYDQIGSPTSANDLAEFIVYIIENNKIPLYSGIYHFANKGVTSWYDLTYFIFSYLLKDENKLLVEPCLSSEWKTEATRPVYSVLNSELTEKTFDYKIPHWTDSLKQQIEKILKNNV